MLEEQKREGKLWTPSSVTTGSQGDSDADSACYCVTEQDPGSAPPQTARSATLYFTRTESWPGGGPRAGHPGNQHPCREGLAEEDGDDHPGRRGVQAPRVQRQPYEERRGLRGVREHGAGVRRERLWGQAGRGKVLGKDQAKRQPCEGVRVLTGRSGFRPSLPLCRSACRTSAPSSRCTP